MCHVHARHVSVLAASLLCRSFVAVVLALPTGEDRQSLCRKMGIFHQLLEEVNLFIRLFVDVGKDVGEAHCRDRN